MRISTILAVSLVAGTAAAQPPRVAVDVAPVHALVARVMEGIGTPDLVMSPGGSPHEYSLRPSEARALQDADVVFWVGPHLTPWLEDSLGTLAAGARTVRLSEVDGTLGLAVREGALFGAHAHGDHDEDRAEHHDEEHGDDPHAWLSLDNAATWLDAVAETLATADPDGADAYRANAAAARDELAALSDEIDGILDAVRGRGFIVFHDAYQYFETAFDVHASGAISVSDASDPSPARVAEIRDRVAREGVTCVLSEPQFDPGLVAVVAEGSHVRTGTLDPLGSALEPGPGLYPRLLRDLAATLVRCLA